MKAVQISQTYKKQQTWFDCHNYHFDLDSGDDTNDVDDVSSVTVAADDDEDMVGWWWWCTSWGSRSPCSIFQAHQCSPSSIPTPKPLEKVFVYLGHGFQCFLDGFGVLSVFFVVLDWWFQSVF